MACGLRNIVACVSGLVLLCCTSSVCLAETETDCSGSACECPSGACPGAKSTCAECPSCDCPAGGECTAGECTESCAAEGCAAEGCQQCCNKSAEANSTTAVLVVDAELLVPVASLTLNGLMGGMLPSDVIAQLATTPTGLAGCSCDSCCTKGNCDQSATAASDPLAHRVMAVRTVLQNNPNCSLQLDPATFTLFPGPDGTNFTCETKIILTKFSELEEHAATCNATVCVQPNPVSPQQATALREAAEQLAKVAVSLEEADLGEQAARARSLANTVVEGLPNDAAPADKRTIAQPPHEELLR